LIKQKVSSKFNIGAANSVVGNFFDGFRTLVAPKNLNSSLIYFPNSENNNIYSNQQNFTPKKK
jgi:hypothetical protein